MSDFVKGYNSMVSTGISEQTSAANNTTLSAMKLTSSFSGALKRIGIGIDEPEGSDTSESPWLSGNYYLTLEKYLMVRTI
jgi:hypothetical protein